MKIKNFSVILIFCLGFIGTLSGNHFLTTTTYNNNQYLEENPNLAQTYINHPPIEILSDAAFLGYSFPGNGSNNNPFIIEGYNITSSENSAIKISHTNSHFIIQDCLINCEFLGIALEYVSPGTSKIFRNVILSNTDGGGGIALRHMSNCIIEQNTCYNFVQGIHIDDVDNCIFHNNIIKDSTYQGINIRYSNSNNITNNLIINSKQHGIAIVGESANNIIHHNRLEGNAWHNSYDIDGGEPQGPPTSQAYDEGDNNIWYDGTTQEGNYWSNYFGIGPYSIDGPSGAVDLYPFHTTGLTPFILIIILAPVSIVLLGLLIYFIKRKRKIK